MLDVFDGGRLNVRFSHEKRVATYDKIMKIDQLSKAIQCVNDICKGNSVIAREGSPNLQAAGLGHVMEVFEDGRAQILSGIAFARGTEIRHVGTLTNPKIAV